MPQIAAYEEVKINRKQREVKGGHAWRTTFLAPPESVQTEPHAFLAERVFKGGIRTHFHDVDQFQVIVSGRGLIGKHDLHVHTVHFARAHTPYGPIAPAEEGLGFLTLRARRAAGQFLLPEWSEKLKSVPERKPWQVTELPKFGGTAPVSVHEFSKIRDEGGLAAYALTLEAHAKTSAPDPATSNGQYLIITKGSLIHHGKDHQAITVIFVNPDEEPFHLIAGVHGLEALVLNFPRETPQTQTGPATAKSPKFRVCQCELCAFTYDEAQGMPDEGVPAGTLWEDVPDDWTCPDCSACKSDFAMAAVE